MTIKLIVLDCFVIFLKVAGAQWWLPVEGANWRKPEGGKSNIKQRFV